MRLLALDPGEMTGYVYVDTGPSGYVSGDNIVRELGSFPEADGVAPLLQRLRPDCVLLEGFRLRPQRARSQYNRTMTTSEIIGIIQTRIKAENIPMHVLPPAEDRPVQAIFGKMYKGIRGRHARAAFRLVAAYVLSGSVK